MTNCSSKLTWCVVRLGNDTNWWVTEISDEIHWDLDGLSIIDPRQIHHIIDLMSALRDYGLKTDLIDPAFYCFRIDKDIGKGRIRLIRTEESLLESEEKLFALPDILDDDKSPYSDLLDHLIRLRVKMLNDVIGFEKPLTVDEIEEFLREKQQDDYMQGHAYHLFNEMLAVLEYVPEGFESAEDEKGAGAEEEDDLEIEDLPEEDVDEDELGEIDEDMRLYGEDSNNLIDEIEANE
ncbi:MAG: hypothetical protein A2Y14_00360 [Verrucomicrobia bacterium GWF2_51_19]|nr:MAG: hypothetical protein A2Y14_00360 [Verrucomicrobia bacterium GWF2_51_19]HBA82839.1 hypothetical protein [Verrucomicrobiota bacterium]